jgi:hypothetical protein
MSAACFWPTCNCGGHGRRAVTRSLSTTKATWDCGDRVQRLRRARGGPEYVFSHFESSSSVILVLETTICVLTHNFPLWEESYLVIFWLYNFFSYEITQAHICENAYKAAERGSAMYCRPAVEHAFESSSEVYPFFRCCNLDFNELGFRHSLWDSHLDTSVRESLVTSFDCWGITISKTEVSTYINDNHL